MKLWIETSWIYCILVSPIIWIYRIYNNSKLKIIAERIKKAWDYSHFGLLGNRYLGNAPYFEGSKFSFWAENVITVLFSKLNKVLDFIVKKIFKFRDFPTFISDSTVIVRLSAMILIAVLGCTFCLNSTLLLLLGLALIACLWICCTNYQVGVYALAAYSIIDYVFRKYVSSLSSVWDELFLIAMFGLWIYKCIRYRSENSYKRTPMNTVISIFMGGYIVLLLLSPNLSVSIEGIRAILQYMLCFFLVLQLLKDEKSVKVLLNIFVCVVGCLAIHGVYQYVVGVEMPESWVSSSEAITTRVYSILGSPNILGSLMVLAVPICFSVGRIKEELRIKSFYYILCVFMLASLAFTYSRGAWIGAACAIGMYVLLKNRKLIFPAIILGILVLVFVPSIGNRFLYMFSADYLASSMKGGRLIRWLTALDILKENPFTGLGLGQFGGAVAMNNELSTIVNGELVETYYMDNYYLKIAVEAGLIGLLFFVWLMYQVVTTSLKTIGITTDRKIKELEIGILAGLTGVIIHNFVENVFEVPLMTTMFWMLVAVMMELWLLNYKKEGNGNYVKN